jgi:preprotein translocase subunit YajC
MGLLLSFPNSGVTISLKLKKQTVESKYLDHISPGDELMTDGGIEFQILL